MKLPKPITDLGTVLAGHYAERDRIRSDIERAGGAATEAERLAAELEALGQRRAELKAQAFISRKPADLSEVDAAEEKLERASRAARSDGAAATIAIGLLNEQLREVDAVIEQVTEERKQLALNWLEERRERAIDRYVKALIDLGPIIAEAAAADGARAALGYFNEYRRPGEWLRTEWRKTDVPIPATRMDQVNIGGQMHLRTPLAWRRVTDHSVPEREALLALFREAGLLDPVPTDAAAEGIDDASAA